MEFLSLKKNGLAIDLSDFSVKFLYLRKRGKKLEIVSFGEEKIKEGLIREGVIKNKEKVAQVIKEGIRKIKGEKIKTKYCLACLPEEKAFFHLLDLPPMRREEIRSAILYQLETFLPFPSHKVVFDFEVVKEDERGFKVLVVSMEKEIVDSYLLTFKKANLFPIFFEVECQSIARALIKTHNLEYLLILDLGESKTTLIVSLGNLILFTTSIPISGRLFSEQIARQLNLKLEKAEKLKIKYGIGEELVFKFSKKEPEKIFIKNKIFEILIPSLTALVEEVKKYIDFFQIKFDKTFSEKERKISKIILSGGQAKMIGLKEFLEEELKIPVEIGNPLLDNLKISKKLKDEFDPISFTTALGLAKVNFYDQSLAN